MKQKTYYHIILDQSGSMQDCIQPTISGFNEQLQVIRSLQQRFPEQELLVGLTRFNHEVLHTYTARHSSGVKELNRELYRPGGSTALYDAIGTTVLRLQEQVQEELNNGTAAVVVVVLTDGYENASRRFTADMIQGMIKELEATGRWTFSYLGATLDAVEVAARLNIKRSNSMSFEKEAMARTYERLNLSLENFVTARSRGSASNDFLVNDQD